MDTRQTHTGVSPTEYTSFPRLTPEQERALIEQARAGEDVRNLIILSLQQRVHALAWKLVQSRKDQEEHRDLVQSANIALLKWFDAALTHPSPYRYLLRAARSAMFDFFRGSRDAYSQRERISIVSLDELLKEDGTFLASVLSNASQVESSSSLNEAMFLLLRQAIASLPEKQRVVIERHYGFGQEPQSLNTIKEGKEHSKHSRSIDAHYQHNKALVALRTALAEQFPRYAERGAQ
jgi:RNA polymerase sigma factor (sigma-70 family)